MTTFEIAEKFCKEKHSDFEGVNRFHIACQELALLTGKTDVEAGLNKTYTEVIELIGLELVKDIARMEWRAKNQYPKIEFCETTPGYHPSVKEKFPQGFFRHVFGTKDDSNRFHTYRQALDAAMHNQSEEQNEK